MKFYVAVAIDVPQRLRNLEAAHDAAEQAWWDAQVLRHVGPGRGREQRAARQRLRQERLRRREAGELLGTRKALLAHSTRVVLESNGWTKRYKPVPAGVVSVGRPWGYSAPEKEEGESDPEFPARLPILLPDELGEQVKRAAYWVSLPAVERLQEWYDDFGDGPRDLERVAGLMGRAIWELGGNKPRAEDLARRRELRAEVITTGTILRLAIDQALTLQAPPEPPVKPEPGDTEAFEVYWQALDTFLAKYTRSFAK